MSRGCATISQSTRISRRESTTLAVLLRRFLVESVAAETFFRFESDLSDAVNDLEEAPATGTDTPGEPTEPAY